MNTSFYDKKGMLYVDCAECDRGRFGTDVDKCCAGYKIKAKNKAGCFSGTLLETIDKSQLKRLN